MYFPGNKMNIPVIKTVKWLLHFTSQNLPDSSSEYSFRSDKTFFAAVDSIWLAFKSLKSLSALVLDSTTLSEECCPKGSVSLSVNNQMEWYPDE